MGADTSRFHVPLRSLKPVRQVVIGASLRPEDAAAVLSGLELADALNAKAHVLHSVAWEMNAVPLGGSWPDPSVSTLLMESRHAALAELLKSTGGDRVTSSIEVGAPYERLLRAAGELSAGLIVAGAARHKRSLLGSTTDKLIRRATCPVLIVRESLALPLGRTLAPIDLSGLSADSFRCGLSFLHQLQAESFGPILALFVLSDLTRDSSEQFTSEQIDRFAREELERFVDEHAAELAENVELKICAGDAREQILKEAEGAGADLIVIGTHGRGGLERALIGSVTAGVAREARCSVLVIPPDVAFGAELVDAVAEQVEPHWEVSSGKLEDDPGAR
jgi:nucleotide-binding universal stress UspA family protein